MNLLLDRRFISEEYQPSCRTNIAASSLPGGQFYQACIRCYALLLYSLNVVGIVWCHLPGFTQRLISQQKIFMLLASVRWGISPKQLAILSSPDQFQVANIEAEMRKVIEELQLNLTAKEFFSTLRNDPANYFGWDASLKSLTILKCLYPGLEKKSCQHSTQQSMRKSWPNFQHYSKEYQAWGWRLSRNR